MKIALTSNQLLAKNPDMHAFAIKLVKDAYGAEYSLPDNIEVEAEYGKIVSIALPLLRECNREAGPCFYCGAKTDQQDKYSNLCCPSCRAALQ